MKALAAWCVLVCAGLLIGFATPGAAMHLCPGDFDGDDAVTVDELIGSVHCALDGCPVRFVDNGDGTITDNWTKLVWEKKSADGSLHDWRTPWNVGLSGRPAPMAIYLLNRDAFAGYTDWRAPDVDELHDLVDYGRMSPAPPETPFIDPLFDDNCTDGCSVTECSCTGDASYWSSDNYSLSTLWAVNFMSGEVHLNAAPAAFRAVRGGF